MPHAKKTFGVRRALGKNETEESIRNQLTDICRRAIGVTLTQRGWESRKPELTIATETNKQIATAVLNLHRYGQRDRDFNGSTAIQWEAICRKLLRYCRTYGWEIATSVDSDSVLHTDTPHTVSATPVESVATAIAAGEISDFAGASVINIPENWGEHFSHIYDRHDQIAEMISSIQTARDTDMGIRNHCMLYGPPGCHAKGTMLLRSSGEQVKVEDVKVGDRLLSHDGYRTVQKLIRGQGNMYTVTPVKGEPFVVNEDHVLTLVQSRNRDKGGHTVDVTVGEWLNWSEAKKSGYKLFRSGEVTFENTPEPTVISPYVMGVMLGNAYMCNPPRISLYGTDSDVIDSVRQEANRHGLAFVERATESKAVEVSITTREKGGRVNLITEELRKLKLFGMTAEFKFVPDKYKYASVEDRRQLLAGYIDTDGEQHGGVITITSKSELLAKDAAFVARSLGLAAYVKIRWVDYKEQKLKFWVVNLSGDLNKLPMKVVRKQCSPRKRIRSVLRTGFSITPCGQGDYYGFTVDGDNLYLMNDYTVMHNCGKSEVGIALERMLGDDVVLKLDATNTTKAGAENLILERDIIPPILILEELEKCNEANLPWLLGIMDDRGEVIKTNARIGTVRRKAPMLVICTVNNLKKFEEYQEGALVNRFNVPLYFPMPSEELLRKILTREVAKIPGGKLEWIEPALRFGIDVEKTFQARRIKAIMTNARDTLLDHTYQEARMRMMKSMQDDAPALREFGVSY